jgi:hypothetical protein
MNQQELEEFAQFLRMAEMSGGTNQGFGMAQKETSWWGTFEAKVGVSASLFTAAVVLFRNFGHTLA